jgi:hypothetical protein
LRFIQQLKTVPSYVSYFLKVVDQHSLQAPFIYGFYSELVEGIKSRSLDPEIEDLRESMQQNQSEIAGMDYGAGTKYTSGTGIRRISTIARKRDQFTQNLPIIISYSSHSAPQNHP